MSNRKTPPVRPPVPATPTSGPVSGSNKIGAPEIAIQLIVLDSTWKDAVTRLRKSAHARFDQKDPAPALLEWSKDDERFVNVGAVQDGTLLSVLRLELIKTPEQLKTSLPLKVDRPKLPCLVLSHPSSVSSKKARGLNLLLRWAAIRAAHSIGIQALYGTFKASTKRRDLLERMGYVLTEHESTRKTLLKTKETLCLAHLNLMTKTEQALAAIEAEIQVPAGSEALSDEILTAWKSKP